MDSKTVFKALMIEKINWDSYFDGLLFIECRYGDDTAPPDLNVVRDGDGYQFEPMTELGSLFCEIYGL